jgi:tetratricopeptide (TPR) repeat protein
MARVIDRLAPLVGEDPAMAGFFAGFLRGAELPPAQLVMRDYFWFRLLSALCRDGPVTVMLDDLQWSTRETLDLAEDLTRRAHEDGVPLTIAVSSLTSGTEATTRRRIARLRERFAALGTDPGLTERIRLPSLDEAAVGDLLDHLFPGNTLAEDHPWLVPALAERSGGNPYHLMQILRLLREARDDFGEPLVSAEGGAWTFRGGLNQSWFHEVIPPGVEDLVRAVVAPLPEAGLRVLEAAAAIGREFEVGLLAELIPEAAALDEGLETLEQADLVRPRDDAGERYRFTNSLVPSVVERMVRERSLRALTRLHREIARALERYHGPRGLRSAARRYARHLRLAGERDEALRWFVTAAEESVRQQLYLSAEMALARAGELLLSGVPATEDVLGRYWSLKGEVSRVTGNPGEALAALQEAIEHLVDDESRATLAATMSRMGRIHEIRGELDRALYSYQVGAQIREDLGDRVEMASSLNELGSVQLLRSEEAKAEEAFRKARRLAEESGNHGALGDALDNLANLHVRRGEWEEAEGLYRQSLELGERVHDRLGVAKSLNGLGNLALRRGDLRSARDFYERAIAIRREVGDREGVANLLSNLGVVHDRMGDFESALRYYRRSADAHREMGSRMGLGTVLNNIGVVSLDRGDVGMAIERFEEALVLRREVGDRNRLGNALVNLAEALALADRTDEALDLLDEAQSVLTGAGDPFGAAGVHVARSGVLRSRGDLSGAEREIAEALRHEGREPRTRALLHLEAAEIHFARGEAEAAERAAVRGRSHAVESGDRLAMAHGLRLEGRAERLRGDRESAERHLDAAEVLLRGTSGPELARVYLERARLSRETDVARAREILMRTRGLLDALEARGAVLPEKGEVEDGLGPPPA